MDYIAVSFQGTNGPLDGRAIFARGYHGLLFNILKQYSSSTAAWLHKHPSPKPFSTLPYYSQDGYLAGLRYALLTDEATDAFFNAWQRVAVQEQVLNLGHQTFVAANLEHIPGPDFRQLAKSGAPKTASASIPFSYGFQTRTRTSDLPLPGNVFKWPLRVWQNYAPPSLRLQMPDTWQDWCDQNVFVTNHQIETADVSITYKERFTGFVGQATFTAHLGSNEQLRIWQALGQLAAFSGIGHKTTMGMGGVHFQVIGTP